MNNIEIGKYIRQLRTEKHLSQKDLADKLSISFQAVSKWETGTTLPDTSLLILLSDILEVTVDQILNAGEFRVRLNKLINIEEVSNAIDSILKIKKVLGPNNGIYKSMMIGLNSDGDEEFEKAMENPEKREVIIAKSCIQLMIDGYTLNERDIDYYFKTEYIKDKLRLYYKKYNKG